MHPDYDLVIVGGGLAGNCLALALKGTGLNIALVEASSREQQQAAAAGDRALALAAGTVKMLEALDIWQGISQSATAIKDIHISDQGHFGKTRLSAHKEKVAALGYVITARDLEAHVAGLVNTANLKQLCPARLVGLMAGRDAVNISLKHGDEALTLSTKLLVGADGGNSSVRKLLEISQHITDYEQTALVTTIKSSLPHHNTAFERFTASGPLALLPVGRDYCSVVWTRSSEDADALMSGSEADFIAELQRCFGYKLGALSLAAPRRAFPLSLIRAEKMSATRTVMIGNAVHQLHPVAGQGFNLGLRDVVQLAEMIIEQHESGHDIGAADFLSAYTQVRQKDHDRTIGFTNSVVKIFSNDWLALAAARNIGLTLLDHIPGAKTLLARHAMGLAGRLPRLGNRR
ncbi:MAG: 2-octaprenyl-6-methoxyphenyl hydroxylase [Methylobacter sp.]|nr:2-octaprenyl-6-methoxyphenyl hydroxylase [Methylobacter sp.]MDP2427659.1 2-octaprenyl-6-methoxyphenyl hydroxylase [Methylobacter sp.]MDP3054075.1 2-octaprenyl-6-methoxyphenyl hydroxylase [Methylobacter sp.]MDP3362553.1 2-octaprenyl-6-methoxyphenyl hydroxylase [Methylobacter sp.]MDZ4221137.1 2-octaprenyl-6-methoxyphenyl hydroxylase [Methylobacter sp.]